jgi:hypothetical protein
MDHNLGKVCKEFKDIQFIRIGAEICPIVTKKLGIKTLPFLAFFANGYFIDSVVGFEGMGTDSFEATDLIAYIRKAEIMK